MPRVIVPDSSTSTERSTPVKSSGATTDITAVASWIGAPSRPAISSARATAKSRRSAARVAAGPPAARMRSRSVAPIRTRWVTSSPTIVVIGNSRNTIAAASGSAQTLNSATAVTLPIWAPPPMIVNPPSRLGREGSRRSARAMLVSGPTATNWRSSTERAMSRMKPTASSESMSRSRSGISTEPRPVGP